jgi:hypothetical protein
VVFPIQPVGAFDLRNRKRARSALPGEDLPCKKKIRDLPIARAPRRRRAAQLDHFSRNASVTNEQRMLRAALTLRGSLTTE